jgi:multidrug efflux system outer membrane protein
MGAEDQLKGQNANIGAARAAFLPRIALTAQGGAISPALQTLFTGASGAWSFAPNLALPIFQGGRNIAGLHQANAQRDAALASYEKVIQTAFREVADALARRGTIDEQLDAQSAQAAAAQQNLDLTNARYQHGTASSLDVLIAQRTAYSARQTLVAARLARANNLVTLYKTLGGGWR